ncbi:MAG: primase-like DNA-binding domain-containing protein, partial [bacterium]
FGRWIIVRFDHKAEKLDKFLIDKITTQEEISGLLNFSLEGIDRLLMNQNFSYQRTIEEIKKEMTMSGSSLAQFTYFELEIVPDSNVFITKDEMHQEFINYIKNNNLPPMHKETLGKDLPKYIKVSSGKKSIKNQDTGKSNQVNCWLGVKFKNPKENKITGIEKINSDDGLFDFPER